MRRIVFWGTGYHAKRMYGLYADSKMFCDDELVAFCDSNPLKHKFEEYLVVDPEKLGNIEFDTLIIATIYDKEIRNTINGKKLCTQKEVLSMEEYNAQLVSFKQYYKRYGRLHEYNSFLNEKCKTMIITAVIGDYDILQDPTYISDDIQYICFTDQKTIKSRVWKIYDIPVHYNSSVETARRIKILPWEYVDINTDYYIWVDAKYRIIADLRSYVREYKKDSGLLLFPHPERECICNELAQLIIEDKGDKVDMISQVDTYLKEGYPINNGLYETACIVRKNNNTTVNYMMEMWWKELKKYTYRDQLSLPYVLWRNDYLPDICDKNVRNNKWLKLIGHKKNK